MISINALTFISCGQLAHCEPLNLKSLKNLRESWSVRATFIAITAWWLWLLWKAMNPRISQSCGSSSVQYKITSNLSLEVELLFALLHSTSMATGKPILIFDNHLTSACYFGPRPTALAFGLCHKFNPMATSPKPTAKSKPVPKPEEA
jgi:hypothetical protein